MTVSSVSKKNKKRPENVNIALDAAVEPLLDELVDSQKTNKKQLVSALITWFAKLSKTERALVLGQIDGPDLGLVSLMVLHRADPAFRDWDAHVQRLLRLHEEERTTEAG